MTTTIPWFLWVLVQQISDYQLKKQKSEEPETEEKKSYKNENPDPHFKNGSSGCRADRVRGGDSQLRTAQPLAWGGGGGMSKKPGLYTSVVFFGGGGCFF
uniref:Uncharacterized protein n=1 Tax=Sphaerodactylus townsendi TaxID=933632 RepID=A0ACB8ECD1_9SAUR